MTADEHLGAVGKMLGGQEEPINASPNSIHTAVVDIKGIF